MVIDKIDYAKEVKELDQFIDSLETKEGKLIVVLHKAQELLGYLPKQIQNHIAHKLELPAAKVFGVVTFYSFFNLEKKGTYKINVCMGTACFVRGADEILSEFKKELGIDTGQTTDDNLFSLDGIRCIGACGLAPVVSVNGKVYGRITKADVKNIVSEYKTKGSAKDVK